MCVGIRSEHSDTLKGLYVRSTAGYTTAVVEDISTDHTLRSWNEHALFGVGQGPAGQNICVLSVPSLRRQYTPKDRILATLLRALRYPTFFRHGQAGQPLSQDVAHGRRSVRLRKPVSYEQVEVG